MIAIIKGCGSNITSIQLALNRLGAKSVLTDDADCIQQATQVILPGVGFAKNAMQNLQQCRLDKLIIGLQQPVLGICLGMQLLYQHLEEGEVAGLGLIPGTIRQLPNSSSCKIPHMGWNTVNFLDSTHPLRDNLTSDPYAYFVHSFAAPVNQYTLATTQHSKILTAMVQYKNFTGVQFHPERSAKWGERLLARFIEGKLV